MEGRSGHSRVNTETRSVDSYSGGTRGNISVGPRSMLEIREDIKLRHARRIIVQQGYSPSPMVPHFLTLGESSHFKLSSFMRLSSFF